MARSRLLCSFFSFAALAVVSFFFLLPSDIPIALDQPGIHNDLEHRPPAEAPRRTPAASFRERIASVRPLDKIPHSRTLGVNEVIVVRLLSAIVTRVQHAS